MRCTNSVEFRHVRALLSKWMKETDIKINFDLVLSQSLFPAGWLKFAHPRLLNRDSLFNWILKNSQINLTHKIHLYPRVMFEYRDDDTKVLTEVLVIDGAYDHKQDILSALSNIKWNGYYSEVEFIPFQVNESFTKEMQIECIEAHNEYCATITSEVITIKRPDTILSIIEGREYRFVDWLATCKNQGLQTLYEAEQIGVTKILIAYFERHSTIIDEFLSTLHSAFVTQYGRDVASTVFGSGVSATVKRSEPKTIWNFFKNIQAHSSNPQGNDDTQTSRRRVNAYYGREPVSTDANDESVFGTKTYSSATQSNTDNSEIVRLTSLVNELSEQVDQLKQNVTRDVTTVVLKDVDTKIGSLEKQVNERIEEIEKKCNSQFELLGKQYSNILSQMSSNNSSLLAAIQGQQVTSSGVDISARGGAV